MTKLEELKAAADVARNAYEADADNAAVANAYNFALVVYRAELNKIQPSRAKETTRGEL
jgi:hypothetical protein